jgi:hypothetical protein
MRKHVYVQFLSQGWVGSQEMSTEPSRWRSALLGTLNIPDYDVSPFRECVWGVDLSSDPRSLNLEVDGDTDLNQLKTWLRAEVIGEFTPKDMPALTRIQRTARVLTHERFTVSVAS